MHNPGCGKEINEDLMFSFFLIRMKPKSINQRVPQPTCIHPLTPSGFL